MKTPRIALWLLCLALALPRLGSAQTPNTNPAVGFLTAAMNKVAAVIVQSTRRILVKLAAHWPWWPLYQAVGKRSLNFSCGP